LESIGVKGEEAKNKKTALKLVKSGKIRIYLFLFSVSNPYGPVSILII
jgi:hypothetical protein